MHTSELQVSSGNLVVTGGYLVVTSDCVVATTGYLSLLSVTSRYVSLLLVPCLSKNIRLFIFIKNMT